MRPAGGGGSGIFLFFCSLCESIFYESLRLLLYAVMMMITKIKRYVLALCEFGIFCKMSKNNNRGWILSFDYPGVLN